MNNITLIAATTAAVATQVPFDSASYEEVIVAAQGLAAAEECDLYISVNGAWVPYAENGAVVTLTATVPMRRLPGGPMYGVAKDATAGAAAVDMIWLTRNNL